MSKLIKKTALILATGTAVGAALLLTAQSSANSLNASYRNVVFFSPSEAHFATDISPDEILGLEEFQSFVAPNRGTISESERNNIVEQYYALRPQVQQLFGIDNVFPRVIQYTDGTILITSSLSQAEGTALLETLSSESGLRLEHRSVPNGPAVLEEVNRQVAALATDGVLTNLVGFGVMDHEGVVSISVTSGYGEQSAEQLRSIDPSLIRIYESSVGQGQLL